MKTAPLPAIPEMDWSLLTPRSREIVSQIGLRLVAGYSLDEIAVMVEAERPERAAAVARSSSSSRGIGASAAK